MNGTIGRCAEALGAIGGGAVAATAGIRRIMLAEAIPSSRRPPLGRRHRPWTGRL